MVLSLRCGVWMRVWALMIGPEPHLTKYSSSLHPPYNSALAAAAATQ